MTRFVALLRGINVGGTRKLPMAALRTLAEELGWREVATHIQSGNLVFTAAGKAAELEAELETVLARRFGFEVPALVRSAREWNALLASNPMPELAAADPAHLLLGLTKAKPRKDALTELRARAATTERVELAAGALWLHYVNGVARSKLTPALLDRCVGSTVTARNWRTAQELARLLAD